LKELKPFDLKAVSTVDLIVELLNRYKVQDAPEKVERLVTHVRSTIPVTDNDTIEIVMDARVYNRIVD